MDSYYYSSSDDSDFSSTSSSSSSSSFSTSSFSSSATDSTDSSDSDDESKRGNKEKAIEFVGSGYDIITKENLQHFLQRIDPKAFLDDQSTNLMARVADSFVNDVCSLVVKLGHFRKDKPTIPDLKFILKREYNMEFPVQHKTKKSKKVKPN